MKKTVSAMLLILMVNISIIVFNIQVVTALELLATEWNQTYGGTDHDSAHSVVQTDDGGYALAGATHSFGAGIDDFWLVKTNSIGDEQWKKTYGGTSQDGAWFVVQTGDGGYALTGRTWSYGAGGSDSWFVKTDSAGNLQWSRTYGGTMPDRTECIIPTDDGGYALAGWTRSFGAGQDDFWLVKTDSAGTMEWNQTYGGTEWDVAQSVVKTDDGGYALAGSTKSFGAGDSDFWLVKVNAIGNVQWSQTYGGAGDDVARSMIRTADGGYALAGWTRSYGAGGSDFWLVKTDADGNMKWSRTYGGASDDEARSRSMVQTPDGGYAITGFTKSFGAGSEDWWLVRTDADGNMQYDQTYGGTGEDRARAIIQTEDGGYALAGYTRSFGAGSYDFWLIKLAPPDGLTLFGLVGPQTDKTLISIDPTTASTSVIGKVGAGHDLEGLAFNPNDGFLYGSTGWKNIGGPALMRIDPATGAGETVGLYGPWKTDPVWEIDGLSFYPITGVLYGVNEEGPPSGGQLCTIDIHTGEATIIGDLGDSFGAGDPGIAFDSTGTLYGLSKASDQLFTIDITTGRATGIGPLGFDNVVGLDFNPVTGQLFGIDIQSSELITIDTTTGQGTLVGVLTGPVTELPVALAFMPSIHEYRRMITIDNTGNPHTLTDFQVFMNVTYDPNMQTDFDDLRFTWYDEASDEEVDIDYWLDKRIDSRYALVWVEIPEIRGSGEEILYVYYGNPYAVSGSNGEETFVFFDGFLTDTTANYELWSPAWPLPSGNPYNEFSWNPNGWLFVNASTREQSGRNSNVHVTHKTAQIDATEEKYWLETRGKAFGTGTLDYFGVGKAYKYVSVPDDNYELFCLVRRFPQIQSLWGSSWEFRQSGSIPTVKDEWYRFGVGTSPNGAVIGRFYDDDYNEIETLVSQTIHQDNEWWIDLLASRLCTDTWATMHAYFDYVRVRKFADPEPSVREHIQYYNVRPLFDDFDIEQDAILTVYFRVTSWNGRSEEPANDVPVQLATPFGDEMLLSESYLGVEGICHTSYELSSYSHDTFEIFVESGLHNGIPVNPPFENPVVYNIRSRTSKLTFGTTHSYSAAAVAKVDGELGEEFAVTNDGSQILDVVYSQYGKTGVGVEFNLFKAKLGVIKAEAGVSPTFGVSSGLEWDFADPNNQTQSQIMRNCITRWILTNVIVLNLPQPLDALARAARLLIDSDNKRLGIDNYNSVAEVDGYVEASGELEASIGITSKHGGSKAFGPLAYAGVGGELELRVSMKMYNPSKVGFLGEFSFDSCIGAGLGLDMGFLGVDGGFSEIRRFSTKIGVELVYESDEISGIQLNFEIEVPRELYDLLSFVGLAIPLQNLIIPNELSSARLCLQYSLPTEELSQSVREYLSAVTKGEVEYDVLWDVFYQSIVGSQIPYSIRLESETEISIELALEIGGIGGEIGWTYYEKNNFLGEKGFVYNLHGWPLEKHTTSAESISPLQFIADRWIYSGEEPQPSGTVVDLEEVEGHLYPHIYDAEGRHVGLDYASGQVETEIPGAYYCDNGDGMIAIVLPPEILQFVIEIDGTYAQELVENYDLQVVFLSSARADQAQFSAEIAQRATYVYNVLNNGEQMKTNPDPAAELEHLKEFIDALPDDTFDSPKLASLKKNALLNKIDEVILKLEAGNYTDAINKLFHDIRAKIDGDSTAQDWIIDRTMELCVIIDHIISSIETLQPG